MRSSSSRAARLEFCRTVPDIVFALIFVVAFGLGPLPGVLAIAIHSAGALGKQFFETTENIDMKPVEGLRSVGASYVQTVRFAALPQVLASFASFALLRFEINVRGATVLGFVGAGGIGQDLMEAIRKFYYSDVSAILVMIIAVVMAIDISTQYLRRALLVEGAARMSAAAARRVDVAAVKARYPAAFAADWRAPRRVGVGVVARRWRRSMSRAFVYFDVPWGRIAPGPAAARLVRRSRCSARSRAAISSTYLNALGETLAIALLGTLLGAAVRAAARHPRGAQRHADRVGCACRSSASSTSCAASTR